MFRIIVFTYFLIVFTRSQSPLSLRDHKRRTEGAAVAYRCMCGVRLSARTGCKVSKFFATAVAIDRVVFRPSVLMTLDS